MDDDEQTRPDRTVRERPGVLPPEIGNHRAGAGRLADRIDPPAEVAGFGRFALESRDIGATIGRAVELATVVTGAPMAWLVEVSGPDRVRVIDSQAIAGVRAGDEVAVPEDFPAAYRTTQPVIITDWSTETRFGQASALRAAGVRSTLSVGVLVAGVTCRLTVHDTTARAFGPADVDVVQSVAHILAAAIERDHHERAQAAMVARSQTLTAFGRFALQSGDLTSTIERALQVACEVLDTPMGLLAGGAGPGQAQALHTRALPGITTGQRVEIPDHLQQLYATGGPFTTADWSTQDRTPPGGVDAAGVRASLSVGVLVEGEPCRLVVMDTQPRRFTDPEQDFLQTVAHVLGAAIERSRSESAQAAVAAFGRFALASHDVTATLARAVEVATEVLHAPMGAVSRPTGSPGRLALVHARGPIGLVPGQEYEVSADLVAATQDTTGPLMIEDWRTETRYRQSSASRAAGVRSSLSVGFPVDREVWRLGVLDTTPRRYRPSEVDFTQSIAHLLASALERHQGEAQLRDSNRQLQQALLPAQLPQLPGIAAAARYIPARGDQVGGDWYDVLPLPHGGIGLVMGDVEGHDPTAAALMGQIRTVVRAYAADGHTPAEILIELNRFVSGHLPRLVTCCYAELHAEQRTVTCVSAGHPVPLVLGPGPTLDPLPITPGLLLGVDAEQDYLEHTDLLPQACALLMVTDGLVDDFPGAVHPGLDALTTAATAAADEPIETFADRLARPTGSGEQRDDAALLAVQLTTTTLPSCDTVHRTFANRPAACRAARTLVDDVLTAWHLHPLRDRAALAVSELVANAVVHTTSPIEVTLRRAGPDRIQLAVRDASDQLPHPGTLPRTGDPALLEPGGRGMIIVEHVADHWGVDHNGEAAGKTVWLELST